jgi:hypothetical protein
VLEITYARNEDYTFTPCNNYFPTPIDAPNVQDKPDVPIGFFDMLLADFTMPVRSEQSAPPPREIPEELYNSFTDDQALHVQPVDCGPCTTSRTKNEKILGHILECLLIDRLARQS